MLSKGNEPFDMINKLLILQGGMNYEEYET